MDEAWLCECDDVEHGELGCTRSAEDDGALCRLCQDDVHDEESI